MNEYEWTVDAIVELPEGVDADEFFDGMWDAVLDYVDVSGGRLGGTYRTKVVEEEEEDDG